MVGYNTDQFYKLPSGVATTAELSPDSYSNSKFLYPGPTRKHAENGHWTDKGGLQRGFMRTLPMTKGDSASDEMKKRRFFFQFNPSSIVRDLSMRDDVRNPLLMDPSEFSVPTPGMTSFGFELFLDRTAELMNKSDLQVATEEQNMDAAGRAANAATAADNPDPLLNGSPSEVGVLADIRVLDTIIGAGITADMMNYIIERGKINSSYNTSDSETTTSYPPSGTDASASTSTVSTTAADDGASVWDAETVQKAFEMNVGNQAFLMPTPVRVVFSSLFMVEGYVSGITVQYPKFNEAMVPMQCSIAIQMQALYMGFAKEQTYFTWVLDNAEQAPAPTSDSVAVVGDQAGYDALSQLAYGLDGVSGPLSRFVVVPTYQSGGDSSFGDAYASTYNRNDPATDAYINGEGHDGSRGEDFGQGVPACFGEPVLDWKHGWLDVSEDTEADPIYQKFKEGAGFSISYTWKYAVTRKALTAYEKASDQDSYAVGEWTVSHTASTADEWVAIRNKIKDPIENTVVGSGDSEFQKWGRGLFIRTSSTTSSLDTTVWKANATEWLDSDLFSEEVTITGSISDGAGNTVPINGRSVSYGYDGGRYNAHKRYLRTVIDVAVEVKTPASTPPINPVTGGQSPVVDKW